MISMKNKKSLDRKRYFIVDSTAIIHNKLTEEELNEGEILVVPQILKEELKTLSAKSTLEILEMEGKVILTTPSEEALDKAIILAKESGDFSALSEVDLQVIALSQDFPGAIVVSDDNAIQNVCAFMDVPVKSLLFKIKKKREYFWKCTVCGSKYVEKRVQCTECGSPLKRFYKRR